MLDNTATTYADIQPALLEKKQKYQLKRKVSMMGMTLREYGEAKGEAKGKAESMTLLLEQRFGPLPRSARDRIAAASIEQLDAWLGHVLEARLLNELLGEAEAA